MFTLQKRLRPWGGGGGKGGIWILVWTMRLQRRNISAACRYVAWIWLGWLHFYFTAVWLTEWRRGGECPNAQCDTCLPPEGRKVAFLWLRLWKVCTYCHSRIIDITAGDHSSLYNPSVAGYFVSLRTRLATLTMVFRRNLQFTSLYSNEHILRRLSQGAMVSTVE